MLDRNFYRDYVGYYYSDPERMEKLRQSRAIQRPQSLEWGLGSHHTKNHNIKEPARIMLVILQASVCRFLASGLTLRVSNVRLGLQVQTWHSLTLFLEAH